MSHHDPAHDHAAASTEHEHFNGAAATWDDDPRRVARSRGVAAAIRAAVDLSGRPTAIELGAGTGLLSRQLADALGPVTLTDTASGMVERARAVIDAEGLAGWRAEIVADGSAPHQAVDLPGGPYGLVLSQLALHHMGDVPAALRAAHAVLAPGGQVAIADLDHDPEGAYHAAHPEFRGHHGFRRADVERMLRDAGFVDVRVATATHVGKQVRDEERDFTLFLATGRRPADHLRG
ncbi:MAG: methyltransferase domain-containing protein [Micrococcales bacterium]|nr:methyltransferase domain-containing protein [Micrococcales bacterium]